MALFFIIRLIKGINRLIHGTILFVKCISRLIELFPSYYGSTGHLVALLDGIGWYWMVLDGIGWYYLLLTK